MPNNLSIRGRLSAVTFDCWQTLLVERDSTPAIALRGEALQRAARHTGRALSRRGAGEILDAGWRRLDRLWRAGQNAGSDEMARWALEALGVEPLEIGSLQAELATSLSEASLASDICALDGAAETLDTLARARVPCALICDTGYTPGRVVRRLLERVDLLRGLEAQIFSNEVGVPKPAAAIFDAALDALGVDARASVHVGDLKRTDVAGARARGMSTVRIRQTHDDPARLSEADVVVDSHCDLRAALADALPI